MHVIASAFWRYVAFLVVPLVAAGSFMLSVSVADAAEGIVACTGVLDPNDPSSIPCGTCELITTFNNAIDFLIAIASIIATIALVVVGLKLVTSGGSEEAKRAAKQALMYIGVGLFFIIAAYAIVAAVITALVPDNGETGQILNWRDFDTCIYAAIPNEPTLGGSFSSVSDCEMTSPGEFDCSEAIEKCEIGSGGEAIVDRSDPENHIVECQKTFGGNEFAGSCTASDSGPCSEASLRDTFGSLAGQAAQIASAESGCDMTSRSGTDTTSDGRSYSMCTWQINLAAHSLNCGGEVLDCPSAFRSTGQRNEYGVRVQEIVDEDLYRRCAEAVVQPDCCNAVAGRLAQASGDMGDWACSAKKCGINTSRNHLCPL